MNEEILKCNSKKSVWSIVITIFGLLFPPFFLISIILSHLAIRELKSNSQLAGLGLAKISMISSYILIIPCNYIFLTCIPN
ncbi:MAG: hypothetical protein COA79_14190 [Planctomycetota bacterium]|nr:MAG: hypothetical protein COA79_14190 [Planctomycetota bacterium]